MSDDKPAQKAMREALDLIDTTTKAAVDEAVKRRAARARERMRMDEVRKCEEVFELFVGKGGRFDDLSDGDAALAIGVVGAVLGGMLRSCDARTITDVVRQVVQAAGGTLTLLGVGDDAMGEAAGHA